MRLLAWCDAPTAPTGFGRSAKHVLHALHAEGYEITQLAVNLETNTLRDIPWEVVAPGNRNGDAYGLNELAAMLAEPRWDMLWSTFDPEVPWKYQLPGSNPPCTALDAIAQLRQRMPGFRMVGWFPVDGGPLSDMELAVLGGAHLFDKAVTMSPHVHDLVAWTLKLRGRVPEGSKVNMEAIAEGLPVIPHGVDLGLYRIPTPEQKAEAKRRLGVDPDTFLVLQVERNQQRKQNYLGLEVLERLRAKYGDKVVLFQHMIANEETEGCQLGYNLPELAWRYGLRPGVDVRWPGGFLTDEDMVATVYAAGDAFLSVSTGEGFQYPAWEALACGMPIVVPNDSARAAWFGRQSAPNAFLYDTDLQRQVMRGGYSRRMAYARPEAAARVLGKMIEGRPKHAPNPDRAEAGRAWVTRHADVQEVQRAWLDLMAEQRDALAKDRAAARIAVPDSPLPEVDGVEAQYITMLYNPGRGDLLMAGPALRALRKRGPVRLEVQRQHLDMARLFDLADEYVPANRPQGTDAWPEGVQHIHELWHPVRVPDWTSLEQPRHVTIAKHLGMDESELEPFQSELPDAMLAQADALFREQFGVDPGDCVVVALQSGSGHRALPAAYVRQLLPHLRAMELVPVLVGNQPMGERTVGIIDLTGQVPIESVAALVARAAAVVSVDSSMAHVAAALGVPLVFAATLFPGAFRLASYESKEWASVEPAEADWPEGETFPAGVYTKAPEGAWARGIRPPALARALRAVLGMPEPEAPRLTLPKEDS